MAYLEEKIRTLERVSLLNVKDDNYFDGLSATAFQDEKVKTGGFQFILLAEFYKKCNIGDNYGIIWNDVHEQIQEIKRFEINKKNNAKLATINEENDNNNNTNNDIINDNNNDDLKIDEITETKNNNNNDNDDIDDDIDMDNNEYNALDDCDSQGKYNIDVSGITTSKDNNDVESDSNVLNDLKTPKDPKDLPLIERTILWGPDGSMTLKDYMTKNDNEITRMIYYINCTCIFIYYIW